MRSRRQLSSARKPPSWTVQYMASLSLSFLGAYVPGHGSPAGQRTGCRHGRGTTTRVAAGSAVGVGFAAPLRPWCHGLGSRGGAWEQRHRRERALERALRRQCLCRRRCGRRRGACLRCISLLGQRGQSRSRRNAHGRRRRACCECGGWSRARGQPDPGDWLADAAPRGLLCAWYAPGMRVRAAKTAVGRGARAIGVVDDKDRTKTVARGRSDGFRGRADDARCLEALLGATLDAAS